MQIGIVGLGLIGGSLAKAFKANTKHTIYGFDCNAATLQYALLTDTVDGELTDETLSGCDYLFLAVYPGATVEYLTDNGPKIKKNCVVVDCGGIKRAICTACNPLAEKHGFVFIGGHPMAGLHRSGLKYASADLYKDASMILTPQNTQDILLLERVTALIKSIGFSSVTVTTPEEHDKIIAFTSQLAHVVSNAYVKSPQAQIHRGFSAGSYKDLTRVARLNEVMWAELFMENRDNLLFEIDTIVESLQAYREALQQKDIKMLQTLLKDGSDRKERIDS
ncbi:MAG: prephenate dehydrogenase [Clostridia bacterium]|nr:prephenate dehydrogenase [Clostridia bacterium]